MASASSTSAKNLFKDSKARLSERIQSNVISISSIVRQILRGSKSNELLSNTAKNFASHETSISNTEDELKRMQVTLAGLQLSADSSISHLERLHDVQGLLRDICR
eukprot:TRINITY_DN18802_c0_g1_i1.p1 TRINITY_DN18802_c0_g1~~TRINITY_DN18802_c0_g1_i1.p1  ORF type:complete len:106 (-),score=30.23 TRINITY_DN18802_c0_g1_i1:496-813(-)